MDGFDDDFPYVPAFQAVDLETDQDMAVTLGMPWPSIEPWETDDLTASHLPLVRILPPAQNSNAENVEYTDGECFRPDEPYNSPFYGINNNVDSSGVPQQDVKPQISYEGRKMGSGSAHDAPASHPDVGKIRSEASSVVNHKKSGGNIPSQTNREVEGHGKTLTAEQHQFLDQFLDSIIADTVERTEERFRESLNSYQRQSQLRAGVVPFRSRSGGGPNRVWPETLR